MTLRLVLFEDSRWRDLRPLTDLVAVPELAFGASTLGERWRRESGLELLAIETRAGLRPAASPAGAGADPGGEIMAVSAAALPGAWLPAALQLPGPVAFESDGRLVGARAPGDLLGPGLGRGAGFEEFLARLALPRRTVVARWIAYPWNLVEWNARAIAADLSGAPGAIRGEVHPQAVVLEPARVTVEAGAWVGPFAVLDARDGPIRIDAGAVVQSQTVVTGPCVVGPGTQLFGGAVGRSTIGPQCRIAGEVEECVWQGYANKRHHGFVGHSLIGEWVNLGALTTTSDLKNNYGPVRVWIDGREMDSGVAKLGAVLGAHVKTGIGSLLPTGASVGVGSNLFGGGRFAPKWVPAFSWWDGTSLDEHRFEPFLATARTAAGRRGRTLSVTEEALLRELFTATAGERRGPPGRVAAAPARKAPSA